MQQDVADDPHNAISVPVILFDGEKETAIGDVLVSPSLQFGDFQLVLCQRIGLSPNQFSVFFTERRKRQQRSWPRKLQITPKFNFASITGIKESYFLVVLKRSRRERAEKRRFNGFENVVLLRREDGPRFSGHEPVASVVDPLGFGRLAMELERESYLWKWQGQELIRGEPVFCHECERRAKEGTDSGDGFHWCANDAVTAGFRSPAGPIARPVRNEMFFPASSDFDRFCLR